MLCPNREIAELHKAKATHASEAQKAALSAEMAAKEELKVALEEFQVLARRQQDGLITQVGDPRQAPLHWCIQCSGDVGVV